MAVVVLVLVVVVVLLLLLLLLHCAFRNRYSVFFFALAQIFLSAEKVWEEGSFSKFATLDPMLMFWCVRACVILLFCLCTRYHFLRCVRRCGRVRACLRARWVCVGVGGWVDG